MDISAGDAEIATLILPRSLIIEYSEAPAVNGPQSARQGRVGAAPGKIKRQNYDFVAAEVQRAQELLHPGGERFTNLTFISGPEKTVIGPGSEPALNEFLNALRLTSPIIGAAKEALHDLREHFDPAARQERQVTQLAEFTQQLFRDSARARDNFFWKQVNTNSAETLKASTRPLQAYLWNEVIGRFTNEFLPLNPRSRKILEKDKWTAFELVLDVYPRVFAWGYLLLPHGRTRFRRIRAAQSLSRGR